ncbi:hypothetical protein OG497_37475 [Streptomyces sp. NBC_01242]|uniref:hypothetical protein n=1 Tax=Streptomyces sp. NBC_01242 TaxID=2903795 RepID=UPI00225335B5|nr:hypothetical protein [Streptomyces sp. NBC_01242]MCX4799550.1 hypothetical protein [Streptomyces sp. NBC_01242]
MADQWGSDVPVSMPQPLPPDVIGVVPMSGFVMTESGLFPDLSAADHERLSRPTYAPYDPTNSQVEAVPDPADDEEEWWQMQGRD